MNYTISAPASHAAHVLLKNYHLRETGSISATLDNIATLIDVATQSFRLVKVMDTLVQSAPWWNKQSLTDNLERLQDAVRSVETVLDNIPKYSNVEESPREIQEFIREYRVSAPALYAAKTLLQHFTIQQRTTLAPTEKNVAILVDVCTQVFRVEATVRYFLSHIPWQRKQDATDALVSMRKGLRAVELVRNRMPSYSRPIQITIHKKQEVEFELTKKQIQDAQKLVAKVAAARTVDEQQQVLIGAGLVKV